MAKSKFATAVEETGKKVVDALVKATDEADEKAMWNAALSVIVFLVKSSKNKIDDVLVIPIIEAFRKRFAL
jgi:ferric iron reductase protein FhuF